MNIITFPNSPYRLHQPFEPAGDQPTAIAQLVEGSRMRANQAWLRLGNVALRWFNLIG